MIKRKLIIFFKKHILQSVIRNAHCYSLGSDYGMTVTCYSDLYGLQQEWKISETSKCHQSIQDCWQEDVSTRDQTSSYVTTRKVNLLKHKSPLMTSGYSLRTQC